MRQGQIRAGDRATDAENGDDGRPDSTARRGRTTAALIGAGRLGVGAAFALRPVDSVRFLGVDTATAARVAWLARMTAARDIALGAGTLASALGGRGSSGWLIAGAACDVADGGALAAALARKQVAARPAAAVIAVAVVASAVAVAAALRSGGQPIVTAVT